jgi:hypothetical protein
MATQKTPTKLKRLAELIERYQEEIEGGEKLDEDSCVEINSWLGWAHDFLTERKLYHKKQQLKRKMMVKVASEHLSADELAQIDRQAEELVAKRLELEEQDDTTK